MGVLDKFLEFIPGAGRGDEPSIPSPTDFFSFDPSTFGLLPIPQYNELGDFVGYDLQSIPSTILKNLLGDGGGGGTSPEDIALQIRQLEQEDRSLDLTEYKIVTDAAREDRRLTLDEQTTLESIRVRRDELALRRDELEQTRLAFAETQRSNLAAEALTRSGQQIDTRQVAEAVRSNMAQEAEASRGRALEAANVAISAYLRSREAADARRLGALQETRQELPFMVNSDQQYFAGFEPSGILSTLAGDYGLPFTPVEIQHVQTDPLAMLHEPTIDPEVQKLIGSILGPLMSTGQGIPPEVGAAKSTFGLPGGSTLADIYAAARRR